MVMEMEMIMFLENVMVQDLQHLEKGEVHLQIQIISKNYVIGIQDVNFLLFVYRKIIKFIYNNK